MNMPRELERVPVDPAAEERAWAVVRAAYARREAARARARRWPFAAAVVAAAVAAAALSPPGRSVVDSVRRTIGIERAAPALFRLPAPGRLLVSGAGGTWVVAADGSKRRLGDWSEAAWSPHGLYVVGASGDELAAVEPGSGEPHWTLARPGIRLPRWGGTRVDTRIAYLSRGTLRVVAGDGTGDRLLGRAREVAPAWQGERHLLAYATARAVRVVDADTGRLVTAHAAPDVRALAWSPDARRLAAVLPRSVRIWSRGRGGFLELRLRGVAAIAFAPDGRLALLQGRRVLVYDGGEGGTVLRAPGRLAGLAWAPDGRWLVTALPAADQWLFVGRRRVLAVSNVARQLRGRVALDGWLPGA